jgi:hypothetical protein
MRKLIITALLGLLALTLIAPHALANRGAEVANGASVLVIFRERRMRFGGGFGGIRCEVTLHSSLHRTIAKTVGALAGFLTEVRIGACGPDGGVTRVNSVTILPANLPWHLTYVSFAGTLPDITSIRLETVRSEFLIEFTDIFGIRYQCLSNANQQFDARFEREAGAYRISNTVSLVGRSATPRSLNGTSCPSGELTGTGTVEANPGAVRARLI